MKVQGPGASPEEWYLDDGNSLLVEEKQDLKCKGLEDSLWKILLIIR